MKQVREACPDDASFIPRLTIAAWQRAYVGIFSPQFLDALAEPDRVNARAAMTRRRLEERPVGMSEFVAELDAVVVGWVRAAARGAGEIEACYVHPDAWGQGVGTALLDAGVRALVDGGCCDLILWTLEMNDRSRRFYETNGWTHDGAVRQREFAAGELTETVVEVRYVRSAWVSRG
jgi:GNAT superfamily N-acetyltransferase